MSNFKSGTGQSWPSITHNKLVENDPQIVKVPMDDVDFGATKTIMGKVKSRTAGKNGKLHIRHVTDNGTT